MISAIAGTLVGCVGSQSCVELVKKDNTNSLNLITLCTHIFVSLEGLIFHSKFFSEKQHIPTRQYARLVFLSFIVNQLNNYAMYFDIHFPLFIIFKSSSLLAHLILRYYLQGFLYRIEQIMSIVVVSFGIVIFTLASYEPRAEISDAPTWTEYLPFPPFLIGVLLLTLAVLLSSYLGICQERLHGSYGNHYREAMFYVHFLSLPGFALLGTQLSGAMAVANNSRNYICFDFEIPIPRDWLHILAVCVFQWVCVNNIYRLTFITSSLTVNMVISLRKFISLFLSFVVFGNPFNIFHAFGALFVFLGTIMYSKVF